MAERKLNEPDNPLTTSQLFCKNARRENQTWTTLLSQQNTSETLFNDQCLRLLSGILWWSLLQDVSDSSAGRATAGSHVPKAAKGNMCLISASSSVWHINENSFNESTKACEMGWWWCGEQAYAPSAAPTLRAMTAFRGTTKSFGIVIFQAAPTKYSSPADFHTSNHELA